ncbi:hypothetical protein FHG87_006501, partial [Trinorchestia longiramus]
DDHPTCRSCSTNRRTSWLRENDSVSSNTPELCAFNMLRWAMCTKSGRTLAIRCSLNIFWAACSVHSTFSTLEDWCIQAFDWNKEELVNKVGPIIVSQLCAANHPENLSEDAALEVIKFVVPNIPRQSLVLLERITHAPMTTCYYEVMLSQLELDSRVRMFTAIVQSYLYSIHQVAQNMIATSVRDKISFLKEAKKSYKHAKRLSFQNGLQFFDRQTRFSQFRASKRKERRPRSSTLLIHRPNRHTRKAESLLELTTFRQSSVPNAIGFDKPFLFSGHPVVHGRELSNCRNYEHAHDCINAFEYSNVHNPNRTQELNIEKDYVTRAEKMVAAQIQRSHSAMVRRSNLQAEDEADLQSQGDTTDGVSHSEDSLDEETENKFQPKSIPDASALPISSQVKYEVIQLQEKIRTLRRELQSYRNKIGPFISFVEHSIHQTLDSITTSIDFDDDDSAFASEFVDFIRQSEMGKQIHRFRKSMQTYIKLRFMGMDLWKWLDSAVYSSHSVSIVSPLRIIHKYSSAKFSLQQILPLTENAKYLSVIGPIGSGKSYAIKYLLHSWVTQPSVVQCPFDYDVFVPVPCEFFSSSQSLDDYIVEILGCHSSSETLFANSASYIPKLKLLFLVEIDVFSNIEKVKEFIANMNDMRPDTKVIFSYRNEMSKSLEALLLHQREEIDAIQILCLDDILLFDFVKHYLRTEDSTREFCTLYEALNLEASMRHPLFVLLSMYLWKKDATFLVSSTCLSRLVMSIMVEFHLRASSYHNDRFDVDIESSNCWADICVKELCKSVWTENSKNLSRENIYGMTEVSPPHVDAEGIFHPFLIIFEEHSYLAHSALRELLTGVYLAGEICRKRSTFAKICCCCSSEDNDSIVIANQKLSSECLIVAAGIWSLTENLRQKTSNKLASLFAKCAVGSPVQWLRFVGETGQSPEICSSVADQLKWKPTWNSCNYGIEENVAVSELLRIEAYEPKKVVLDDFTPGIVELVSALAICPSVAVIMRLERHFYSWNDRNESDDLVELLQPAGNLVELWAHLNVRGALATRHMKKLTELNVRVTSVDALMSLIDTMPQIPALKSLSLRLDIPKNVPASLVPSMSNFKGQFWLRLHKVDDSSCAWALHIIDALQKTPMEIHLQNSWLSPNVLHTFKKDVGTANVFIA